MSPFSHFLVLIHCYYRICPAKSAKVIQGRRGQRYQRPPIEAESGFLGRKRVWKRKREKNSLGEHHAGICTLCFLLRPPPCLRTETEAFFQRAFSSTSDVHSLFLEPCRRFSLDPRVSLPLDSFIPLCNSMPPCKYKHYEYGAYSPGGWS